MTHDDPLRKLPPEDASSEEIEILEVVGVDETGAPVDGAAPSDDVEVVFEEADEGADENEESAAPAADAAFVRERLIRLQADFENFKKRVDRERHDHLRHATGDLVTRLLPILDNFERAMASARGEGGVEPFLEGVGLIQRQLIEELRREGLRPMDALGAPFDPEIHEAVATDTDAAAPDHTVTHVFQRGYYFHDRVLRPALVRVRLDVAERTEDVGEGDEA
jgi:molecular chaperone GrpE